MQHIATTLGVDMHIAIAWAETIPYQNDFSIVKHLPKEFAPYTDVEIYTLFISLPTVREDAKPTAQSREDFIKKLIDELNRQRITSELPPDVKRVASLETHSERNIMATSKKTATKKAPVKKKVAATAIPGDTKPATKPPVKKKAAVKKVAAPKVERERKNGMMRPKDESKGGRVWSIADALSKKAGAPAIRKDVMDALPEDISIGCAGGYFQDWRRFHGLSKKVVPDTKLKLNASTK